VPVGHIWECQNFAAVAARSADLPPRLTLDGKAVNQIAGLGGFAEQILVHQSTLVTVPPDMPLDRAALLGCGVITGAGAAINTAGVRFGDTVAVIGCGGVGLSVVQGAAIAGALEIIAIDVVAEKAERARTFGATATVCAVREDAVAAVRDLTGGAGVHYSFEVVGLPETAAQALQMVRRGGVAYMLGVQRPGSELTLDPFADLVYRQRSLHGVYMGSTNFKYDSPIYSQMYLQGRFNLDGLVSQTVAIEDINRAYDDLKAGRVIRSVITF